MSRSKAFHFQQFTIEQDQCAMKVGIDSVLLGAWTDSNGAQQILDIGTGTGILALMLAQRSKSVIDAIELNREAFLQASENIKHSKFASRIRCFHGAFQDFIPKQNYDLIISNPPYFEKSLKSADTARNTARHTDALSLDELLQKASQLITASGEISLILPSSSLSRVEKTIGTLNLYLKRITEVKGKAHKAAKRILLTISKEKNTCITDQITIYTTEGGYTKEFRSLTKDYYLPSIFR